MWQLCHAFCRIPTYWKKTKKNKKSPWVEFQNNIRANDWGLACTEPGFRSFMKYEYLPKLMVFIRISFALTVWLVLSNLCGERILSAPERGLFCGLEVDLSSSIFLGSTTCFLHCLRDLELCHSAQNFLDSKSSVHHRVLTHDIRICLYH